MREPSATIFSPQDADMIHGDISFTSPRFSWTTTSNKCSGVPHGATSIGGNAFQRSEFTGNA